MSDLDAEEIIEILVHIICAEEARRPLISSRHNLKAADFDGFEPLTTSERTILIGNDAGDQPIWPMDIAIATTAAAGLGWDKGSWQFTRVKTLKIPEWRGKIHKFYPKMIDCYVSITSPSGTKTSARTPYAILGSKVIPIKAIGGGDFSYHSATQVAAVNFAEDQRFISETMKIFAGLALRRRYHWSVLLGEHTGPRARFVTDTVGIREAFKLRDVAPGRSRRAALMHWVAEHWRKRREPDASDRQWIDSYLRGQRSFNWNGLLCHIEPSQADAETIALRQV